MHRSNINWYTECYQGSVANNICPPCPSNQDYMKQERCKDICGIFSPLYLDGFYQSFTIYLITYKSISTSNPLYSQNLKWSLNYDSLNVHTSSTQYYTNQQVYGIFHFNSGIQRFLNELSSNSYSSYLIGIKIIISLFHDIPLNSGIQFKIIEILNKFFILIQASLYINDKNKKKTKTKLYIEMLLDIKHISQQSLKIIHSLHTKDMNQLHISAFLNHQFYFLLLEMIRKHL